MKSINRRNTGITLIVLLLIVGAFFMPKEKRDAKIKIGVAEDCSGMIIDYMLRSKEVKNMQLEQNFEAYSVKDCCSTSAQWALSSQLLDIVIMCPSAAEILLQKDSRFEILGPCILNGDILVNKEGVIPASVGITQNRSYVEKLVKEKFGLDCNISPMLTPSLPYALEKNLVQGIVVDALKGLFLKGDKSTLAGKEDIVSYVVVVSKKFKKEKQYKEFIDLFQQASGELNTTKTVVQELEYYKKIKLSKKEEEEWNKLGIKFVFKAP